MVGRQSLILTLAIISSVLIIPANAQDDDIFFFWPAILNAAKQKPSNAKVVTLNTMLSKPWGLTFLLDGRILITQKVGSMLILSADGATVEATVDGLPSVLHAGQGGFWMLH